MKRLEEELRQALQRREPPPGFAERVLARARARQAERRHPRWWGWRWLAPVAAAAVVAVGLHMVQARRQRLEGEAAKQQLLLALELTGSKLRYAEQRIQAVMGTGSAFQY